MTGELEDIILRNPGEEFYRPTRREPDDVVKVPTTQITIDRHGSIYEELDSIPAVARLGQVKQLGMADTLSISHSAHQNRYAHTLAVATKLDYIAQTRPAFDIDRTLAVTAGMMHDIATPPYSDSVAKPLGLDDQEYFRQVLENDEEAMDYLERHDIDPDRLERVVRGEDESPLGQLVSRRDAIDVDRWAYVIEDGSNVHAEGLIASNPPEGPNRRYDIDPFEYAELVDGTIAYTNTPVVHDFLELRAEMFETFYKNPKLLAKEAFLGSVLQDMWEDGVLDEDNIFELTDGDLAAQWSPWATPLLREYDEDFHMEVLGIDRFDRYGTVSGGVDEVEAFLSGETEEDFEVRDVFSAPPAVGTPVIHGGDVAAYAEARPGHASELQERLDGGDGVAVYGREHRQELAAATERAVEAFGGEVPGS